MRLLCREGYIAKYDALLVPYLPVADVLLALLACVSVLY